MWSGRIASVFATGLGPITPAQEDGTIVGLPLPTNRTPFRAYLAAGSATGFAYAPLDTPYAGLAPYEAAGVSQIHFTVTNSWLSLQGGSSHGSRYMCLAVCK